MKNILKTALLAFSAACLTGVAAHASITLDQSNHGWGDIILDFTQTSGTANLEVNLGEFTQFAPGGVYATGSPVLLAGNNSPSLTDLSNAYGSTWNSASDNVFWSLVSDAQAGNTLGVTNGTIWGSAANNATVPNSDNGTQTTEASNIQLLISGIHSATATANSTQSTMLSSASTTNNNYNYRSGITGGALDFFGVSEFTTSGGFQVQTVGGASTADLYQITPGGPSTDLGTFSLNSSGMTFTAAAVPEPSTWATMILGAGCLLAFRRHRALRA